MERTLRENSSHKSATAKRVLQGRFTRYSQQDDIASRINGSPQMTMQRKKLQSLFGGAAQLQGTEGETLQGKSDVAQRVEEEEPLQGKFEPVQRVEEEEPLQGKFEAVQRVEEEEPLQGKFEPVQRVEEEEPLQGKFEPVQRVEEEEPLQGKFETVQRVEEEEPLQGKFEAVQRVEEEEPLQGKFMAGAVAQPQEVAGKPNNTGLPDNLKSGVESLSGVSMDNVKVHYNSSHPAQLNALAYAQGKDIHVAPGQERHLPHEAWHVVQQAQGRVRPTTQMKGGVPVNDDCGLEHEADVMGARALGQGSAANANLQVAAASSNAAQLWPWSKKQAAPSQPEEVEMQSLSTPKEGDESHEEDQTSTTKSGLKIKEDLPPEQKKTLKEKGDLVVGTIGEAKGAGEGIVGAVKTVEVPEKGLELANNAGGVFTKIKDGFSNVAKVFSAFVSPIIEAGMHFLGMKEKWGQWSTYDAAAKKEDAPQEAVYAKDKTKKGFLRHLGLFFHNIADFVANLLLVIPGANVIAAGFKLFNLIAGVIKSIVGAAKGIWQFFKGEKKDVHSASLLDKALKDDDVSLKLIFDLKLPSIAGSGYALIDTVLGKISEMSESTKASIMKKFGMDAVAGQRIIDINKKKAPTTKEELSALLKLACKNSGSKELILKELKETMTGFGK